MAVKPTHVKGKKKGEVMLYALSTCGWCRKTRQLLDSLGVEYDYVYVDLLNDEDNEKIMQEVEKWNPSTSFPTIIVDRKKAILGFKEDEIKKTLG